MLFPPLTMVFSALTASPGLMLPPPPPLSPRSAVLSVTVRFLRSVEAEPFESALMPPPLAWAVLSPNDRAVLSLTVTLVNAASLTFDVELKMPPPSAMPPRDPPGPAEPSTRFPLTVLLVSVKPAGSLPKK